MKQLLILAFSLCSLLAQAQTGFPAKVTNNPDNTSTRNERLGDISTVSVVKDNFIFRGNMAEPGENMGATYPAGGGRATYLKSIVLTASRLCVMRVNYGIFSNLFAINASTTNPIEPVVGPNAPVVIPINQTIRNLHAMPQVFIRTVFECSHQQYVAQVSPNTLGSVKSAYTTALNNPSNSYTYTLAVSNSTGSATSGNIVVTDSLPDGVKITNTTTGVGGWTIAVSSRGRSFTATSSAAIANGANSTAMTITLTPQIAGTYTATYITDDVPNDRPRSQDAVFIGTSITDNTNATNYTTGFPAQVCTYLRETKGIDVDLVPFGKGGSTSSEHEFLRKNEGRYNFDRQPWGIFYEAASVNDILQSVPTATSVANLNALMNHKKKFYPGSYLFILSPTPNANSSTESSLATLRTALQSAVSTNGDSKTYFISGTGSAWSPANTAGKTAADGIHPTDSGYADIATAITTALSTILP